MAKTPQGGAGKQKISLAPVKSLSEAPAMTKVIAPVVAAPKATVAPKATAATPAPIAKPAPILPKQVAAAPALPAPVALAPVVPAHVMTKPALSASEVIKPEIPKTETVAPKSMMVAPKPVAVAAEPKPFATPAPTAIKATVAAVIEKPAKTAPAPVLSLATIPMHPGMTDFAAETWFAPALNAFRTLAAFQGKVLDHACAELKASLAEVEALARAASPSEAVALQGKAFSRRLDASSAHIADLTTTVRKIGKAA